MAHSLALFEQEDVLCVSDRENAKIDCMKAGLRWPIEGPVDRDETGVAVITYTGVGRTYAIAAKGNTTHETHLSDKIRVGVVANSVKIVSFKFVG